MRTQIEADLIAAEPVPDRRCDGSGRLDPCLHVATRPAWRSEVSEDLRQDAGFRFRRAEMEAHGFAALAGAVAATTPIFAANAIGLRFKGEHLIKGMCPPYYDTHERCRRCRGRGKIRASTASIDDTLDVRTDL